ncbi:hypothetical protein [Lysinibacillus sp. NPDC086135]|uniref:hypothetical protein n=1 Tax=Lysinibacillus sp. NPDC086135 TaxID=3364130 RepID=UPI0037F67DB9
MITKEIMIQKIIDYNFQDDNFTLEGVIRFLPRRLDKYGHLYGWNDDEVQQRFFLYILNIRGFKHHLENKIK